jgi:hypothetical protein
MLCSKCARVSTVRIKNKFIESTYSVATVLVHIYNDDIIRQKKKKPKNGYACRLRSITSVLKKLKLLAFFHFFFYFKKESRGYIKEG